MRPLILRCFCGFLPYKMKFNAENGHPFGPQEEAERMMRGWFPTLKRWKKA